MMTDQDYGETLVSIQAGDKIHDHSCRAGIDTGGWLVEEKNLRLYG
jgi:hypothetical protein